MSETVEFIANALVLVYFCTERVFDRFRCNMPHRFCSFINYNKQMKCLHFRWHTLTSCPVTWAAHTDMTYYTDLTLLLFLADHEVVYCVTYTLLQIFKEINVSLVIRRSREFQVIAMTMPRFLPQQLSSCLRFLKRYTLSL